MVLVLSDADLVRRIGSGDDRDAEGELYRRMAPRVRLHGLRHLRDGHAADDLTQQVLITTLEALRARRLREPEKLASFVLGTCRMTVLDLRPTAATGRISRWRCSAPTAARSSARCGGTAGSRI